MPEDEVVLTQGGKQLPPQEIQAEVEEVAVVVGEPEDLQPEDELTDEEMDMIASKEDVDACIDAIRELTEVVGQINAKVDDIQTTLKAGKF